MIFGSRIFYWVVGLALLLFTLGFLSTFNASTTAVGQVRVWQETEQPSRRQTATMKPGNRWDADFGEVLGEQSTQNLSEIFELVGVVNSGEPHALVRVKDPKDARVGDIIRVTLGGDLAGGVKMTQIDESRMTLKLGDEQAVFFLYENFEWKNKQTMEKRVDSQR